VTTLGKGLTIREIANSILDAVVEHWAAAIVDDPTVSPLPERQYVAPGDPTQIAWDCEQVVVAIQGIGWGQAPDAGTLSPGAGTHVSAVGVRHAIYVVQLIRCTPSDGDIETGLPSPAAIQAAGDEFMRDMGLLSQALMVACATVRTGFDRSAKVEPGAVNPDGPSGGFHGMSAQIAVTAGTLL
jgi:hypothetical protein